MALEIKRLAPGHDCSEPGLIVMTGHQDGILAFGKTSDDAGKLVLATLVRAKEYA